MSNDELPPLDAAVLPAGVRSRFVATATGLRMHFLEAGAGHERPLLLLLHGFPEIAYSWRKVMPALAAAGYHVVAPDQRGYGRTTGWDADFDGDVGSFAMLPLVRDLLAFVAAVERPPHVACVVGHDFGAPVAAWCALTRPDVFDRAVLMSAPFSGPPAIGAARTKGFDMVGELARLQPPRQHYQWYYSTRDAARDMQTAPDGLHTFLRAYFHVKSADWPGNVPHALGGLSASELALLPRYYIMDAGVSMPATVAPHAPSAEVVADCRWLPDDELAVYAADYARTGFQGGLNWYRCRTDPTHSEALELFAGRTIEVPALYVAGAADWGTHQTPGAFEAMQRGACSHLLGCHLIPGAGHWVQQEQPEAVVQHILDFVKAPG